MKDWMKDVLIYVLILFVGYMAIQVGLAKQEIRKIKGEIHLGEAR